MRAALQTGIQQVVGINVIGSGARPFTAPRTKITKHPRKQSTKRKAKFRFKASEPATFKCKLDKRRFRKCSSPYAKKVGVGKHRFRVRATDRVGKVDSSPAKFKWKVKR